MEMNNLQRVESHVAQKNRRHKLRFQHNSGDLNHHQFEQTYNVLPSHLLLPTTTHGSFVSHNNNDNNNNIQDPSNDVTPYANLPYTQDCNSNNNIWKPVVSSQQQQQVASHDHWMNTDHTHSFSSTPFYHNTLHQQHHVTLALPPQGLSLSLSSVPHLKEHNEPILQPGQNPLKSDLLPNPDPKSFVGVSGFAHRNTGPLGPFTGYATILKNSKYIKPAQELLTASCEVGYQELVQTCHDAYSQKILEEEMSRVSDRPVGSDESFRPEFHRKKARLLYMQEEVCKRYKQYLQQMQMVISSFETVAGLSAATPYVCLALKALSRHFYHVKNVISEQLSQMTKTVGEGLCSSTNVSKTFDANATSTSRMKSSGGGGAAGFFVAQQPVWRPQRGLPERAIAVLKTWLFDHFLHPYPSDADKHMLATQTGLTRNQVSNWFINARVRIWKPMVEEIHTLETKGLTEANSSLPQPDGQDPNWMDMSSLSNTQPPECSRNPGVNVNSTVDESHGHLRDHEKQPRPDQYDIPLSGMDRLMSIMPYPRATFDTTGLGPVSLTLGLRQNAEHVQQLQQHFGGQLIHDFVG